MAERTNPTRAPTTNPADAEAMDKAVSAVNDPGGAHRKGYSAQPGPARPISDNDPVPLAPDSEIQAHVQKPDQSQATPGSTSTGYSPNDRVTGADR